MSILFTGVENWLLSHVMCGTKRLNPFFRLHEASVVLNKYEMGVWQARRRDFAARGAHFLNTILDVCSTRGPNTKWRGRESLDLATTLECGQIRCCLFH